MEKLLRTAVADADVTVRKSIFVALYGNQCFDDYLAQADSLTAIFASLNDEVLLFSLLSHTAILFCYRYFICLSLGSSEVDMYLLWKSDDTFVSLVILPFCSHFMI